MSDMEDELTLREKIAAILLDRDERPGDHMRWAESFIRKSRTVHHHAGCQKRDDGNCPQCTAEYALVDADRILATLS